MCLFPIANDNINSVAYKKGVRSFDCGACPECLSKKSNIWALRAVYESRAHRHNCMITLTYDAFKYADMRSHAELPVDPTIKVDKTHIQKFIKRLRKYISTHRDCGCDDEIKYIACAEYGSHTHRAHYHLILFGVQFKDRFFYKKSKRGNAIYMSHTLEKLWKYGICTIDSINVHSSIARYCTKYCAKSRSDETFMLFSHNIGLIELLKDFNGKSYIIDGREYSVPRTVWNAYIMKKYNHLSKVISPRYINHNYDLLNAFLPDDEYEKGRIARKRFLFVRDRDPEYQRYLSYWQSKAKFFSQNKLSNRQRIYLLDDRKYHSYKVEALKVLDYRERFVPYPAPGSGCVTAYIKYKYNFTKNIYGSFVYPSRLNKTNDTKLPEFIKNSIFLPFTPLTIVREQCIMDLQ